MGSNGENTNRVLGEKRQYKAPHLLVYGEMARLTADGSKPGNENFGEQSCSGQDPVDPTGNKFGTNSNCMG